MEDFRISRRQGLKALGATVGAAVLGTGLAGVANAAPAVRQGAQEALSTSGAADPTKYYLWVDNQTDNEWDMCVYQEDPDLGVPNVMSLAWFVEPCGPHSQQEFSWEVKYSYIWCETGQLRPGVSFANSQHWPADPSRVGVSTKDKGGNQVGFAHTGKTYGFKSTPMRGRPQEGVLYITEDSSVPLGRQASVGIGMGGAGTFAVQSEPNLTLAFEPHPIYYVTAGQFSQSEVIDIGAITSAQDFQYPQGMYNAYATLAPDNTWSIAYKR
jgi:rhizosphere induced protein